MNTTEKELEEMTATDAILNAIRELSEKCKTIEEFREALARILPSK